MCIEIKLSFSTLAEAMKALARMNATEEKLSMALDRAIPDALQYPPGAMQSAPAGPLADPPACPAVGVEKPKRKRRTNAELNAAMEAAGIPQPVAAPAEPAPVVAPAPAEPAPVVAPAPAAPAPAVTLPPVPGQETTIPVVQMKDALLAFAQANGKDAALALLKKYGAEKISDVPPENRAALIVDCTV